MKKKVFFFTLFLVFRIATVYAGQGDDEAVKVSFLGVESHYMNPTSIPYSIQNNTGKELFFYCNVETKVKNNWREVSYPITNTRRKEKYSEKHPLEIGETKSLIWSLLDPAINRRPPVGTYRFKAVLRDAIKYRQVIKHPVHIDNSVIATVYSHEFQIKYPVEKPKGESKGSE